MIYTPYGRSVPSDLDGPDSPGGRERAKAIAFYADEANRDKPFAFSAYGSQAVRDRLDELFHGKCAYCESEFRQSGPADIEHWRPKGAIKEEDGTRRKPGYYWLAAEWHYLLPSCPDCNRVRRHRFADGEEGEEIWRKSGKGMLFPLDDASLRVRDPGPLDDEKPLLIHPGRDHPEDFLAVVTAADDPDLIGVMACRGQRGYKKRRGEHSIRVYGLNRPKLKAARHEALRTFAFRLQSIRCRLRTIDGDLTPEERRDNEWVLAGEVGLVAKAIGPSGAYALAHRAAFAAFLEEFPELRSRLTELVQRRTSP